MLQHLCLKIKLLKAVAKACIVGLCQLLPGFLFNLDLILQLSHIQHQFINLPRPLVQHFAFEIPLYLDLFSVYAFFEPDVCHFAPSFKKCPLSLAMKLVLNVALHSALALLALGVVLPRLQNHPVPVMVSRHFIKLVQLSLLDTFLLLKLTDAALLL